MSRIQQATGNLPDDDESPDQYLLRLFIAGASAHSLRAITNLREICETYLPGRYTLEVIDVHKEAGLAEQEQIIALPMLIKVWPEPKRRMIGDMTNTEKVLKGLGIIS